MAYQKTTASSTRDLLNVLHTFATSNGWTSDYNLSATEGQISINRGNCQIAIGEKVGENPIARTQEIDGGTVNDAIINMALHNGVLSYTPKQYWSHTDSLVVSENDGARVRCNDLAGSFTNVWFFSEAVGETNYIHVVTQSSANRWTQFSFGDVNPIGMTHTAASFCIGQYYTFWQNQPDPTSSTYNPNNPASNAHDLGYTFEDEFQIRIASGTTPAGYPNTGVDAFYEHGGTHNFLKLWGRYDDADDTWGRTVSIRNYLDGIAGPGMGSQPTTGGVPMWAMPVFFCPDTGHSSHMCLGILPDVRVIGDGRTFTPGQEVRFGEDLYTIFPWKTFGTFLNCNSGDTPTKPINTLGTAFAFKKNV